MLEVAQEEMFPKITGYQQHKSIQRGNPPTIKHHEKSIVIGSRGRSEGIFHKYKSGKAIRVTVKEMGHPQQATPMQSDNYTADRIANYTIKKKRTKSIDISLYQVQD